MREDREAGHRARGRPRPRASTAPRCASTPPGRRDAADRSGATPRAVPRDQEGERDAGQALGGGAGDVGQQHGARRRARPRRARRGGGRARPSAVRASPLMRDGGAVRGSRPDTTNETVRASRMARAPTDAAALTASSNSASSAYAPGSRSSSTMSRLRRVSSNWRTMNVPVFAELFQWMKRRSSPGTYSRSAWNAMSLAVRSRVGEPSRSRMKPGAEGGDGDGARMHVQLDGLRPDDLAPHEADRVGAHGAGRADRDDPAPLGGDAELLVEGAAARAVRAARARRPARRRGPRAGRRRIRRRPGFAATSRASAGSPTTTRGVGSTSSIVDGAPADQPHGCRRHEQQRGPSRWR